MKMPPGMIWAALLFLIPFSCANRQSKAENITMTLQYLNADGTVLYEGAYTFADLAAAVKPAA